MNRRHIGSESKTLGRWTTPLVLLAVALAHAVPAAQAQSATRPETETQWWKGVCETPGIALDFIVVFKPGPERGQYTATIDIPVQMAKGLPLIDVVLSDTDMRFTIAPPAGAVFELTRTADAKTATGELKQHGMTFPAHMQRITEEEAKSVGPPRPQTPKPPFPYTQRDVTYENSKDSTKLAGTLTIPEGAGPHPAVLLITGSGPQDRDETIFGHKPFFVIADHLTRHGIAVLRVDDRGVGGSTGAKPDVTTADFATDVEAGVAFLKHQPEIDPRRIGLLGHSEGGEIAPLVAAESHDVACIVLLSGPGLPGSELLILQNEALLKAAGASPEVIKRHTDAHRAVHECVARKADEDTLRKAVQELVTIQLSASGGPDPTPEQIDSATKLGMAQFTSNWLRWFLTHDPRETLRKVKCPVLALGGSLDLQVPPKENLPEIEKALKAGGNTDATTKELPGLNHLFQEAKTGQVAEYATIDQTFSPTALDVLTIWLRTHFKLETSGG